MRLSKTIIDGVIREVAGEDVVPLVRALKNKKNVSEFVLADNLDKEINETRNMLYRLYHSNLVSFTRKKDKKKGWYIYYWTFNTKRVRYLTIELKKKRLKRLVNRLQREEANNFMGCPNCSMRVEQGRAMEYNFKCPECNSILEQTSNTEKIMEIKTEIEKLKEELKK